MTPNDDLRPTVPRTPPAPVPADDTRSRVADSSAADIGRTADHVPPDTPGTVARTPSDLRRLEEGAKSRAGEGVPGYVLLRELGRGGMGVVYEARHAKLNRVVALKMMLGGERAGRAELIRFLAEAEAVAAVRHENVVGVYDYGEADGRPFMALEYCPGGTLARKLPKGSEQATAPREMAALVAAVARGVAAAHALGIVHRDLKPGNVFLGADGTLKVADFGLAKRGEGAEVARAGEAAARQKADTEAARATSEAKRADEIAYRMKVITAGRVWGENNVLRALRLLSDTKPEHRDFEWRYVAGLCDASVRTIRPGSRVNAATVSADGRFAYFGCVADRTVRGYDLDTGKEVVVYRGHAARPVAVALLGGGKRAASAALDGSLDVWDTATGERVSRLVPPDGRRQSSYPSLAAAPDGKRFALLGEVAPPAGMEFNLFNGVAAAVWDADTLQKVRDIKLESGRCLAFHPDGRLLIGGLDARLRAWDVTTGRSGAATTPYGPVTAVAVSPDGGTVWTGDEFGRVFSWKGTDLTAVGYCPAHDTRVWQIAVSPDGKRVLTASLDQTAALWDATALRRERVFRGHFEDVMSVAFRADGRQAVTAGDATVRVWDVTRDAEARALVWPPSPLVPPQVRPTPTAIAFSPDGRHVAATTGQGVYVWETATGEPVPGWPAAGATSPDTIAFTPDGHSLAGASLSRSPTGAILSRIWVRPLGGGETRWIDAGLPAATRIAFDRTGARLAVTGLGTCVLDVATGKPVWTRKADGFGAGFGTGAVAFSPDGKLIATAEATTITICDAATGTPKHTIPAHSRPVMSLAFSPDGTRLASGSQDTTVAVWDVATGGRERQLERTHDHYIYAVAFSPDGKRMVDASGDKTVRLYDARSGDEVLTLKGHTGEVVGAAFSPTGHALATCGTDGTVRLWAASPGATAVVPKEADQPASD